MMHSICEGAVQIDTAKTGTPVVPKTSAGFRCRYLGIASLCKLQHCVVTTRRAGTSHHADMLVQFYEKAPLPPVMVTSTA